MFTIIALYVVGAYLVIMADVINTSNMKSTIVIKVVPRLLGLFCLAYATYLL